MRAFGAANTYATAQPPELESPVGSMAPTADGHGYWLATTGGGIFSFGDAVTYGSLAAKHLPYQVVQVVATPSGRGYWLALSNGGVYSFGNASFHGSLAAQHMGPSVVAMAATPDGDGYWLATAGGHVYPFGDARSEPLDGGNPLRGPVTAMARTPDGRGYWLATSTGSVYAFGDAKFKGSWTGVPLTGHVVAMSVTPSGHGYWLATSGAAAVPRCQPGELSIAYDPSASSGGAAGSFGMTYRLTDTSSSTCKLHGYPGLQLRDQQGKPLPTTTIRSPHGGVPTVVLAPGAHAWFDIEFATQTGFGNLTCPRSTSLAVIPPNDYSHLVVGGTGGELAPYGGTTEDLRCGQIRTSAVLAAPSMPAKLAVCRASQLHLASDKGGWHGNYAASNQFRETFTFTNISKSGCQLDGWPTVEAVVAGIQRPTTEVRVRQNSAPAAPWAPTAVWPSGTAAFDIYGEDYDLVRQRTCLQTTSFSVGLPEGTGHILVSAQEPDCGSSFYVAPLIASSTDVGAWTIVVTG